MCLGLPGRVLTIEPNPLGMTMGMVDFAGEIQRVCLAYVPEAQVGDYVLANIGFATARLSADEAQEVSTFLCDLDDLLDADLAPPTVGHASRVTTLPQP